MKTLLMNGKVYVEREQFVEAVFVEDGVIKAIGTNEEMKALAGDAEVIDCEGKTVVPGFNDSHMHLQNVGDSLYEVNIFGIGSIEEMVTRCQEYIAKYPERCWNGLVAAGWNQDIFAEKRMPNRHDLDRISTEIPIILHRVCHHIAILNTKAIEALGMDENTPEIPGGEIQREENGYPSGIFCELGAVVVQAIKPRTEAQKREILAMAMDYAAHYGVTSVQANDLRTSDCYMENLALFQDLYKKGEAKARYRAQASFGSPEELREYVASGKFGPEQEVGDLFKMGPVKLFKDGSLGGRTAYMRNPYNDAPETEGIETITVEDMDAFVQAAADNGLQVATHVIGDRAISETLDAYEKSMKGGKNVLRHGLVHCQITDMDLLKRIAALDVLPMVQPVFLDYDMTVVEDRVGKELASTSYAFKTMEDLGCHVSYGTDSPVEDCNPYWNLYAAVTRLTRGGQPEGGFYANECVDIYTAVDAYTAGSAYTEFMEDKKGRIKPGYLADMVVLNKDIFTIDPKEIRDMYAELTMMDGKVVYRR